MELVANRRPFLYFPLTHHLEQNFHVTHRLDRYRAGRRMDYAASDPDAIAAEIGRTVDYRPVETDGAAPPPTSSPNSCESQAALGRGGRGRPTATRKRRAHKRAGLGQARCFFDYLIYLLFSIS
jgi:hypothetical protein